MLSYRISDVIDCLGKADNLNAALKHYLKKEVKKGSPEERFIKDFRKLVTLPIKSGQNKDLFDNFVEKNIKEFEPNFFGVLRHCHSKTVDAITIEIIEKHADKFNETYEVQDDELTYKDKAQFERIVQEVDKLVETNLAKNDLPPSNVMKNVIFGWIFDPEVLPHVLPLLTSK